MHLMAVDIDAVAILAYDISESVTRDAEPSRDIHNLAVVAFTTAMALSHLRLVGNKQQQVRKVTYEADNQCHEYESNIPGATPTTTLAHMMLFHLGKLFYPCYLSSSYHDAYIL